jgi:single-stranded-DNA-specific exonuclease
VIGIVASRVVERIHRPTVLIALGAEEGKGSARSIPGFHLHRAFVECESHLTRYGGHRAAAGCSIDPANVAAFRTAFGLAAEAVLKDADPGPEVHVDAVIGLEEANHSLCRLLRHFGPFGIGNPTPVFASMGVSMGRPKVVGTKHLKLTLAAGGARLEAIGFGMAERLGEVKTGARYDVAFRLEENQWRNPRSRWSGPAAQARLIDFRVGC